MTITLVSTRNLVRLHLMDLSNLIWSDDTLDEALRSALSDLSRTYGELLTLAGLDAETETTFDDLDLHPLIEGTVAYALSFRVTGRFEEATPEPGIATQLADWSQKSMESFQSSLVRIQLRRFQLSGSIPHAGWDWDEGVSV